MDVVISAIGLLFLSPLFLILAILIKMDSPGPVFYRARRVGKDGKLIHLLKFRTMVVGADERGPRITIAGDSRVTRIGRSLRRTKLDEVPQLFNVLKGEMSLVGPRPEDPRYAALYPEERRQLLDVRPGITSAASLAFRHEEELLSGPDWEEVYRNEILPAKLAIELAYQSKRTIWDDLVLIARTILTIFQ